MKKFVRCTLRVLPFLWMAFIWSNSMQPASQSSEQSMSVLGFLDPLVQLLPEFLAAHAHHIIRKLAHAFEFAVLGALWYASLSTFGPPSKKKCLLAAVISFATAALDESIQLFEPGRSGQLSDVFLDSLSALLTIGAAFLLTKKARQGRTAPPKTPPEPHGSKHSGLAERPRKRGL